MSEHTIPLKRGQRWTYVGPHGRKALHTVVHADPGQVITYSDTFPESESGGETWLGRPEEFKRTFRLSNSCE